MGNAIDTEIKEVRAEHRDWDRQTNTEGMMKTDEEED